MTSEKISTLDMSIADVNSEFLGVKRLILMENAGRGLADLVQELYQKTKRSNIVVFCGRGGNGGDGMVAARHLARYFPVSIYFLGSPKDIKKQSTQTNFNIIQNRKEEDNEVVVKATLPGSKLRLKIRLQAKSNVRQLGLLSLRSQLA